MTEEKIWSVIGHKKQFCSFKMTTETQTFCRNKYNVTGLCDMQSCPIANYKYATVREHNGKLYLLVKEPERVNTPKLTYEKIELSTDYHEALTEIDKHLLYHSDFYKHKCKQRLTKLHLYLQKKDVRLNLTVDRKKMRRQEIVNAKKVEKKVDFDKELNEEIMKRIQYGVYGQYVRDKFMDKDDKVKEKEKVKGKIRKKRMMAYFEESDEIMGAEELRDLKRHRW